MEFRYGALLLCSSTRTRTRTPHTDTDKHTDLLTANTRTPPKQNLETSLVKVKDVGFISISVLYFVFMLACLGTPVIVSVLGSRWSIVVAFACFVLFCIANVLVANAPTNVALAWGSLVPTGALTGFAASFLWTAQGEHGG